MNEQTQDFVRKHREDDVRRLALKGAGAPDVDLPVALQQIAGWQTARRKLPTWAANEDVVYPPHLNMEQCSSELTARYKASLVPSPSTLRPSPFTLIDLTGGFGVDFYFMALSVASRTSGAEGRLLYVEQNPELCKLATHNFRVLGLDCEVVCGSAEDVLQHIDHVSCIYLDPARRDNHGGRTYALEDCTPNVLELQEYLLQKADRIILKLSPMLDWHKAVSDLKKVSQVHIVSVQNECKELVAVIDSCKKGEGRNEEGEVQLVCVNLLSNGTEQRFETLLTPPTSPFLSRANTPRRFSPLDNPPSWKYLYEPNASIMKAGCFEELAQAYAVRQLSPNSHLFVSNDPVPDFSGRGFLVERATTLNKQELKAALTGMERANITVRNFPMSAEELRKKLRLKDGGEEYIFATTLADGGRMLFICRKIV